MEVKSLCIEDSKGNIYRLLLTKEQLREAISTLDKQEHLYIAKKPTVAHFERD